MGSWDTSTLYNPFNSGGTGGTTYGTSMPFGWDPYGYGTTTSTSTSSYTYTIPTNATYMSPNAPTSTKIHNPDEDEHTDLKYCGTYCLQRSVYRVLEDGSPRFIGILSDDYNLMLMEKKLLEEIKGLLAYEIECDNAKLNTYDDTLKNLTELVSPTDEPTDIHTRVIWRINNEGELELRWTQQ